MTYKVKNKQYCFCGNKINDNYCKKYDCCYECASYIKNNNQILKSFVNELDIVIDKANELLTYYKISKY